MSRACSNKTVTNLAKLDGIAAMTFNMSFAIAATLTVFSTWTSLISMLLAYHNPPVNINAFITFANPEKEMTKANRKGRSIVDAGYYKSIRVVACTGIRCTKAHRHWYVEEDRSDCVAMHCAHVCASSRMIEDLRPNLVIAASTKKRFRSRPAKELIGAETSSSVHPKVRAS